MPAHPSGSINAAPNSTASLAKHIGWKGAADAAASMVAKATAAAQHHFICRDVN
jgi:hypothetical protein